MCLWAWFTIHVQEFYDVDGDLVTNRKTVAVVLTSEQIVWLRYVTAIFLVGSGALFLGLGISLANQAPSSLGLTFFGILQFLGAIATGYRLVEFTSRAADEGTYKKFFLPTSLVLQIYLSHLNPHY